MNPSLRVLIVEDSEDDCLLLIRELRSGGYEPIFERVETAEAMKAALDEQEWKIVISDYSMPHFSALDALKLLQETGLDLPFLVVSGTIGEDVAVEAMKAGANDYFMKGNLKRLCPAVERELREAKVRRERKQAEEALRESEERYRSLFRNMLEGFAYCKMFFEDGKPQDFIYLDVNDTFGRLTGLKDVVGKKVSEIIPGIRQSNPELFEIYGRVASTGNPERFETYLDSLGIWFSISVYSTEREYFIAVFDNITERKRAEKDLRDSEARYRAVVEQSPDAIFLVDVDTKRVLEANSAFQQMLAYSAEEMKDFTLYDFVSAPKEDVDRRFQEVRSKREPRSFERQYRRKDGSLIPAWIISTPISYGGRQVVCYTVRDLTEKKALDAQFLRAQRMETIGLLAGGIAHDLNNILSPILINAELLSPALSEPTSQKMLSSIASNAQRGADIVKQILAFARGMEGEYLFISPRYLLKETERFVKETFPKTIAIHAEIPPDLWPLSGDATQLHQVLMNLCLNAKDAMEKGGTLSLSAENSSVDETYAKMHPEAKVGSYVVFSVEDTGCGILPSHLEKIFDPFFTTKERGQGTGLGLATAHGIVKGHGGFLNVYSELGRGTKFHVYLPASPSAEMAKVEKERAPLPSGQGELILVVEDEASIREITQIALETVGYRAIAAADGAEAVSLYAQHPGEIKAVITDMAMPIMDGPTTIRALQKMDPAVKVIAISGLDAERMVAEASGLAVQAFLQKPFTAERLLRTVGEILRSD